jgi:thiamine-monophosphate kinase
MSLHANPTQHLGEFDLIARLTDGLRLGNDVVRGVGDDAAVLQWPVDQHLVVTCDAQVEGTHFLRSFSSPEQIGRRALSVNLSDLAAMGARPKFALVSLIVSKPLDLGWLDQMYAGLRAQADAFGVSIVGGNIASSDGPTCIDITVFGQVPAGGAIRRDGGHAGDRLYVSGELGSAVAGLASLRKEPSGVPEDAVAEVRLAYCDPQPQVALGEALGASHAVTSMIDISDGLSSDLHHICMQSGVGAVVDEQDLPISLATRAMGEAFGVDALDWALHGGDAYQLLFSISPDRESKLTSLPHAFSAQLHPIGWLTTPDQGVRLRHADATTDFLPPSGWDHLKGDPA